MALKSKNITVYFNYRTFTPDELYEETGLLFNNWPKGQIRQCTSAFLVINYAGENYTYVGLSVCNPIDNFNKTIGRKNALKNAVQQTPLSKQQRRELWEDYFEQFKKKRKEITVVVSGGVIQDIFNIPTGTNIIVRDYDVESIDSNRLEIDENNDEYFRGIWRN